MLRPRTVYMIFFFLMIRRPPRSTLDRSSAASDVYKRQGESIVSGGEDGEWAFTAEGFDQTGGGYSRDEGVNCLLYTSPSPRDRTRSRMPSSA